MYAFDYEKAQSLAQAAQVLGQAPEAKLLAGGMSLLPSMKHRLAAPSHLIDICALPDMQGISYSPAQGNQAASITIGAAVRHAEVADSPLVRQHIPALADLAGLIGDPQVRARGTLGGSVANNDPAADYPAGVLGLNATVLTNQGDIAARDFFKGMFSTALKANQIITAIRFSVPKRAAYAKFAQMATGYAMTGVMLADYGQEVRVAVTGAGPGVFRWLAAEKALAQSMSLNALQSLKHPADSLNTDIHASAEYRAQLISVMTRKALQQLLASGA